MDNNLRLARQRMLGAPVPNVDVVCPYCKKTSVSKVGTHQQHYLGSATYYFRKYSCNICSGTIWIAIDRETNETVYPSISPVSQGFFELAVLYSHEQVLNGEFKYSPRMRGGQYNVPSQQDLLANRKTLFNYWKSMNGLPTSANLVDLYLKTFHAWMKELPETRKTKSEPEYKQVDVNNDELDAKLAGLLPK